MRSIEHLHQDKEEPERQKSQTPASTERRLLQLKNELMMFSSMPAHVGSDKNV